MAKAPTGTYVYCVIAASRAPRLARLPAGLPRSGRVRLLDLERGLYLAVADVPLARYGEAAIERSLSDLEWVSRAAVAHEAVVESFIGATAVLPMKLLTIFNSDRRAIEYVRADRSRIDALVKRVANHDEWGVRVMLNRARAEKSAAPKRTRAAGASGLAYLSHKKAQRDASLELTERAREAVATLYDRLSAQSRVARRRGASELPAQGGPLLLDAAFLVPRSRSKRFQAMAAREARSMSKDGYDLMVTGPWPPYTFVQD
jgi:gas vesicle protein GvpL/GvpF